MMIKFHDKSSILLGDVKTTNDGYRLVRSKIARTGVQKYYGFEFDGQAAEHGFGDRDEVSVYRDPADVFSKDAVNGWAGVPVTINHPDELVTPENVTRYQVGDVRDKAYIDAETGWFGLEWLIRDATAISDFDSGKFPHVSGGYTAIIDWTPGITPDGKKYDAKQTGIKPNHLAMVSSGRAFSDAAKWGASPINVEDEIMTVELKTVILGDATVEVKASDAATVASILKDHKTAIDDKDVAIGELKAKLAAAESKIVSDEAMTALVDAAVELRAKRDAVKSKFGDEAVKDASDAMIDGMYRVIDKAVTADDSVRKAISDAKTIVDAEAKIKAAQDKFLNREVK